MKVKIILIVVHILGITIICKAQKINMPEEGITTESEIESLVSKSESEEDYFELIESRLMLLSNPLDINTATESELQQLALNEIQIKNLHDYILLYGEIAGLHELALVEGFDSLLVTKLSPYITFKINRELHAITLDNLLSRGKNQVLSRYQTVLQTQKGFIKDSSNLQKQYLGSQSKVLLKYGYNYYDRLRFGFLAEKDPGETLFPRGDSLKKGFDFYSFHAFYKGKGLIRNVAIGDYHLQFGQGLTMYSSFSISKLMTGSLINRRNSIVKPSTGANENSFFRGAAVTLEPLDDINITLFYSNRKIDGAITVDTTKGTREITSIYESGYHRTLRELQQKHSASQQVFGGNIQGRYRMFKLGATITQTNFSEDYKKPIQPYNMYDFRGSNLLNLGIDFSILYRSISLFGEISASDNWAKAYLLGGNFQPSSEFGASLLYRSYSESYHNFFSNAFSEGSGNSNEKGLYIGLYTNITSKLTLSAFADHYKHEWLKYRIDAPSSGREYNAYLTYTPNKYSTFILRYNHHDKQINHSGEDQLTSYLVNEASSKLRFHLETCPVSGLTLKSRLEYIRKHQKDSKENAEGFVIYQDVIYHNDKFPWTINIRYALFDTDSYNERIYAYESDMLYNFSVPAYYDKGTRFYILGKYSINRDIHLWIKYSSTYYFNKETIGSGLDEIKGSLKSEVKAQILIKL